LLRHARPEFLANEKSNVNYFTDRRKPPVTKGQEVDETGDQVRAAPVDRLGSTMSLSSGSSKNWNPAPEYPTGAAGA
jgi:hypothetical protein